ncbi:LRR receptor-like serine threonine-protein kinase [Seminavis robusta]|uniref:LRR receptor-like serine threonine-protein kinase n=1 Tax=Seminavis robusta TaxID=568900 RepID=A0A9N8HZ97_9STRA|nr:LRR receptor-like serine threonine-protein kinase [Seminavis robusta]|eukprot:Sro2210_g319210.1 LRR receptor-like serine threonine-protein kinase (660) ;mRNA; f:12533-14512
MDDRIIDTGTDIDTLLQKQERELREANRMNDPKKDNNEMTAAAGMSPAEAAKKKEMGAGSTKVDENIPSDFSEIVSLPMPMPRHHRYIDDPSIPGAYAVQGAIYAPPSPRVSVSSGSTGGGGDIEMGSPAAVPAASTSDTNNDGLVEARPVTQPQATADEVVVLKHEKKKPCRASLVLIVVAVVAVLVLAVSFAVAVTNARTDDDVIIMVTSTKPDDTEEGQQKKNQTLDPTLGRLLPNYTLDAIRQGMSVLDGMDSNATTNVTLLTPQYRAYDWLTTDMDMQSYADDRLVQRFALATFFFSTKGYNWTSQTQSLLNDTNHTAAESLLLNPNDYFRPQESLEWYQAVPGSRKRDVQTEESERSQEAFEPWLSPQHECQWWSLAPVNGYSTCNNDSSFYVSLDVEGNNLAGELPPELGLLTTLESIFVGRDRQTHGPIVSQIGQLTRLRELHLGGSQSTGTIPTELARLSDTLEYLGIGFNRLTGTFPSQLTALSKLEQLKIDANRLHGTLPKNLGSHLSNLRIVSFYRNQFNGTVLSSLIPCANLAFIDIAENQFADEIPSELGTLTHLTRLFLPNNRLHGTLPSTLALLPKLGKLNLHNNVNLTGPLPPEFAALNQTLTVFQIQGTGITGTIPEALCGMKKLKFDCSDTLCGCDCPCG